MDYRNPLHFRDYFVRGRLLNTPSFSFLMENFLKRFYQMLVSLRIRRSLTARYILAFGISLAALLVKYVIGLTYGPSAPFLLMFSAVLLSTIIAGWGPGVFTTITLALGVNYFFLEPTGTFFGKKSLLTSVFIFEGILVSSLNWASRRAERTIQRQLFNDNLTGLPNRKSFDERLEGARFRARLRSTKFALLFIDLDLFKNVNDMLGHKVGDLFLKKVASRLNALAGKNFICRLGGDEFAMIIHDVKEPQEIKEFAEKIRQEFERIFRIQEYSLHSSVSIGAAIYPDNGPELDLVIKNANAALYNMKDSGRNGYRLFSENMKTKYSRKLSLAHNLPEAINTSQFFLNYQPIISVKDGSLHSVEALVRWQHPQLGLIPPDEFIKVAEDTGNIFALGGWVLKTACQQAKNWHDQGFPKLKIAVNISVHQLSQNHFVESVRQILLQSRLEPQYLELEITESVIFYDYLTQNLRDLNDLGISLSLDDFGAGHSSLGHLKNIPLSTLKIDKSFIENCGKKEIDTALLKAIITMAQTLGLKVIAEGVENGEQVRCLHDLGCDLMQGFYLSKPLSAHRLEIDIKDQYKFNRVLKKAVHA